MKYIFIQKSVKVTVIIDDEDYDRIAAFKWRSSNRLSIQRFWRYVNPLILIKNKTKHKSLANEIMGTEGILYDHKDRNPLNFCKDNLRAATYMQNAHNRKPIFGKSKYKGVCIDTHSGRWIARIVCNKVRYRLGYFDNEVEAAKAYDNAAKFYHKEFAFLNFKEP